jgi:hypothetical protein
MFASPVAKAQKTAVASSMEGRAHQQSARVAHPLRQGAVEPHTLGRTLGNQARLCLLAQRVPGVAIQPKLTMGPVDDPLEREADHVADRVMRIAVSDFSIAAAPRRLSRACTCDEELRTVRTKRAGTPEAAGVEAPAVVDDVLRSAGRPLEASVRSSMERRFGHDFSRVRIHDDGNAAASADAVRAEAYTVGSHVVFGAGRYAGSPAGERLLAHELAHVVQQQGVPSHGSIRIVPADHASEREAHALAAQPASGAPPRTGLTRSLQRYGHEDCKDADLKTHIWPADGIAKKKVNAAIAAVSASPVSATTAALFAKYFMTSTPKVATILKVLQKLKAGFDANKYTYECEEDCDADTNAYSGYFWDIHLCMNNLRGRANDCIARTIVHEFSHKYAGTDDNAHCYDVCDTAGCPATLSASDALDNAYSFGGFAHEL